MNKQLMSSLLIALSLVWPYVVQAENSLSIDVNIKDTEFNISLPANPTTGYQWQVLNFNKKLITLVKSQFQKPQTQLMGAGGIMIFTFTLNKNNEFPESTLIVFKYSRPWEAKQGSLKKVSIYFIKS